MSADSTTRAAVPSLPAGTVAGMGRPSSRRRLRWLFVLAAMAGAAAGFREWKLTQNARRFGLPG